MKKLSVGLLVFLASALASAQSAGHISTSGGTCALSTSCVILPLATNRSQTASINVAGTFSGALQFETSVDFVNWSAVLCIASSGGGQVSSTTSNGIWVCPVSALTYLRVRGSSLISGFADVGLQDSTAGSNFTVTVPFAGIPSGACTTIQLGVNTTNGALYTCNASAWQQITTGSGALSGLVSNTIIDVSAQSGADFCIKLRAAFQQMAAGSLASNGLLDARAFADPQYCSVNPFYSATNQVHGFTLLLGEYNIYTSVPWVTPRIAHRIIGATDAAGSGSGFSSANRQGTWLIACNPKGPLNTISFAPSQCDSSAPIANTFPQGANGLGIGKEETGTGYENVFYSPHGVFRGVPTIVLGRTAGTCSSRPGAYLTEANITAWTGSSGGGITGTPTIGYQGSCTVTPSCEFANSTGSGATCTATIDGSNHLTAINITAAGSGYINGLYSALIEDGVGDDSGCMNTPVLSTGWCDGTADTGGGNGDLFRTEIAYLHLAPNGLPNVFGIDTPNMQEGSWVHDISGSHFADAEAGDNNATFVCDTAISGGSQCTHETFSRVDTVSNLVANGKSSNGWGVIVEGMPTYIDIPQGTCESKPRGFVDTFTTGNPSHATVTYNGGTGCTNGAPTTVCHVYDRLGASVIISSASWAANVATIITVANHNLNTNDVVSITEVPNNRKQFNGIFTVTVDNATQFHYTENTNPGGTAATGRVARPPYDATYMGTTCTATVANVGGNNVVTAITVSGGSGLFRNKTISAAPFEISNFTCQGANANGMAGCIGAEGVNDIQVSRIHAESMGKQPTTATDQFRISGNMGTVRETQSAPGPFAMGANLRLGFGNAPVQGGFISNVDGVNDSKWASVYLGAGNNQDTVITSVSPNSGLYSVVDDNNCATNTSATFPCSLDQGIRLTGAKVEQYSPQGIWILDSILFGENTNTAAPNAGFTSLGTGSSTLVAIGNGTKADESAYVRTGNVCRINADVALATSATTICNFTSLGATARTFSYDCDWLWSMTAGSQPLLTVGVNYTQTPSATTNISAEIKTTNANAATEATVALSATGNTQVLSTAALTASATIFQARQMGTLQSSATSGSFSMFALMNQNGGTAPSGVIRAGSQCHLW